MDKPLIDRETAITLLKGFPSVFTGAGTTERMMRWLAIGKINKLYQTSSGYKGTDFTAHILEELGIVYRVGDAERLNHLREGAFITIANHPYGGLDGIMLIDLIGSFRQDYKFMVNSFLSIVQPLKDQFITVAPATTQKPEASYNLRGIRETLQHLERGHPAGIFPSGAVSDFRLRNMRIKDRCWQSGIIRLVKDARVPVVPVRFFDGNSPLFYGLGLIHWKLRSLRLPGELFNKRGQSPRIAIGRIISVDEQKQYPDLKSFSAFLRDALYGMPKPEVFIAGSVHAPSESTG
ncbi:MAG: lysophospholipid acyltransferase family protein [Bacteroidales bacterium]